jgi:hypothetical protein
MAQPGFKLEKETTKPTMKQKAIFILKLRRKTDAQIKSLSEAIDITETLIGKFVRTVYERSSAGVHTEVSREEVLKIRDYVILVLLELLEICRT